MDHDLATLKRIKAALDAMPSDARGAALTAAAHAGAVGGGPAPVIWTLDHVTQAFLAVLTAEAGASRPVLTAPAAD